MSILKTKISYNQVVSWGAVQSLGESIVRKMFRDKDELTISEILEMEWHPHFTYWILMRPQVVTSRILHEFAQFLAEDFVKNSRANGIYVDFRTDRLLRAKQQWLDHKISSGNLTVHTNTADEIMRTVEELNSAEASKVAYVIKCLLQIDPMKCYKLVYINTADFSNILKEHSSQKYSKPFIIRLNYLLKRIEELENDKDFKEEHRRKIAQVASFNTGSSVNEHHTVPVGTIMAYAGAITDEFENNGWMVCDGRVLDRPSYKELFEIIGGNFGYPDDSRFNIPDLRGVFLRCVSDTSTNDPDKDARTALNINGNSGNKVGSLQSYATAVPKKKFTSIIRHGNTSQCRVNYGCENSVGDNIRDVSFHVTEGGDIESRPVNKYVHYIIKYSAVTKTGSDADIPIGSVIPFAGIKSDTLDLSWKLCDGTVISNKGEFENLFNAIGFAHGGRDALQFKLPDYRGYFLRGVSLLDHKDPDQSNRECPNQEGPYGYKGNEKNNVGSVQKDATAAAHNPLTTTIAVACEQADRVAAGTARKPYIYDCTYQTVEVSQSGGDDETRPKNISVNWYIKYR